MPRLSRRYSAENRIGKPIQEIKPWMRGPFELIRHADGHLEQGGDFDLRIGLINYDNSIEASIATYIDLEPEQRYDIALPKELLPEWKRQGFHYKTRFLTWYVTELGLKQEYGQPELKHVHAGRNDLYHGPRYYIPPLDDVVLAQNIAKWVFNILYRVDVDLALRGEILAPDEGPLELDESAQERQFESYLLYSYQTALDILRLVLPHYFGVAEDEAQRLNLIEAWQVVFQSLPDIGHQHVRIVRQVQDAYDHILRGEPTGFSPAELRSLSDEIDDACIDAEHAAMDAGLGD